VTTPEAPRGAVHAGGARSVRRREVSGGAECRACTERSTHSSRSNGTVAGPAATEVIRQWRAIESGSVRGVLRGEKDRLLSHGLDALYIDRNEGGGGTPLRGRWCRQA
jgi:hypothetical protein